MHVKDAVLARKSIRAFKPDPVPKGLLVEIMERALWAPSWANIQPWQSTIVGGKTRKKINEECLRIHKQGISSQPDYLMPREFNETQTTRLKTTGKSLFQSLGITREDREKRNEWYEKGATNFGAPNVIYLHLEKDFHPYNLLDCGLILQTVALLATEKGLGTCISSQAIDHPQVVHKHAGIPSSQLLIIGVPIGYPVPDHPANTFRSQRGNSEEFISWVDID